MSRVHHHRGGEPSQRMLRVAELIRHALSELLARSASKDPVLDNRTITIPEVRMSPDLKLAKIYIMPLGGEGVSEVLASLERHKKHLRAEIARHINLKFAPELRFHADPRFEYVSKINSLLELPQVKRDINKDQIGEE